MTIEPPSHVLPGEGEARQPTYQRIVVALDGSPLAEAVLPFVEPLALTFGAEITIICAQPYLESTVAGEMALSSVGMGGEAFEQIYETDEEVGREDVAYLAKMRKRLSQQGLIVHTSMLRMGPAEAIVSVARRTKADLIAMTTHGRSGVGRAILGSVADEVLRTSPCPVLLVHPRGE